MISVAGIVCSGRSGMASRMENVSPPCAAAVKASASAESTRRAHYGDATGSTAGSSRAFA